MNSDNFLSGEKNIMLSNNIVYLCFLYRIPCSCSNLCHKATTGASTGEQRLAIQHVANPIGSAAHSWKCACVYVCSPWCPLSGTRLRPRCRPSGCWSWAPCRPAGRPGPRGTGRCCCSPSRCCPVPGTDYHQEHKAWLLHSDPPASLQRSQVFGSWCPCAEATERPSVFQPVRRLFFLLPCVKLDHDAGK